METIAPSLVDHGIQTEDSDIRCHVAPGTQNIFVFQTAAAQAFIAKCIARIRARARRDTMPSRSYNTCFKMAGFPCGATLPPSPRIRRLRSPGRT